MANIRMIEKDVLKESSVENKRKNYQQISPPSVLEFDYGLWNQYKLDHLIDFQSDGLHQNEIIRIAYVSNHSLHLEEEMLELLNKYATSEILFVGIWGSTASGKSFLLDKILNLSNVQGNHFTNQKYQHPSLLLYSLPFTKNHAKIFLVDSNIHSFAYPMSFQQETLLTFFILLCSTFIVLSDVDQNLQNFDIIAKQFKKCMTKNVLKDQQLQKTCHQPYFPTNVFTLFRSNKISEDLLTKFNQLFESVNFGVIYDAADAKWMQSEGNRINYDDLRSASMNRYSKTKKLLNQLYISSISSTFADLYSKVQVRSYLNLRHTGVNLSKLLINICQFMNLSSHSNYALPIDKIYQKTLKQLYIEAYNYHIDLYNEILAKLLANQCPYTTQYLIQGFQHAENVVISSFKKLVIHQHLYQHYYQKILHYIDAKEKIILEINKKKSIKTVQTHIQTQKINTNFNNIQDLQVFLKQFKQINNKQCEVGKQNILEKYLYPMSKIILRSNLSIIKQDQKFKRISEKLNSKQNELKQIQKNKSNGERKQQQKQRQRQLNFQISKLKQEVKVSKLLFERNTHSKSSPINYQKLEQQQKLLKKSMVQNIKYLNEINSQIVEKNPQISKLQDRVKERQRQRKKLENELRESETYNYKVSGVKSIKSEINKLSHFPRKVQTRGYLPEHNRETLKIISSPKI